MPIEDQNLSEHFSLFELTKTSNEALRGANREGSTKYLPTLRALAAFLERLRAGLPPGPQGQALCVNSAFRSAELNGATKGSSPTSQHPMGQAADIHRPGEDPGETFKLVLAFLKRERISFGQLIDESADRGYSGPDGKESIARWVHVSLGCDFWKPERCGEVMRKWDQDGKPNFEMLEQHVNQEVA